MTAFQLSGWNDGSVHYLPQLTVTAPARSRPVLVQRIDFTTEDAGVRRLLKAVRYIAFELLDDAQSGPVFAAWRGPDVAAGATVTLRADAKHRRPWFEIQSASDATRVAVVVSYVDGDGRGGQVSGVARVGP